MRGPSLVVLSLATVAAASGQLLFRIGADGRQSLLEFLNPSIIAGLVLYAAGTAGWIYALSKEPLVQVYAFTALTFALVYVGGVFFLGERLSGAGMFGVGLVLAGLYFIAVLGRG